MLIKPYEIATEAGYFDSVRLAPHCAQDDRAGKRASRGLARALAEVVSPAFGEGVEVDGAGEQIFVAGGSVVKMIDIGDRYFGRIAVDDFDSVSGSELTFFDH